jgi:AraC family transcriptional activator of pobA
MRCFRIPQYTFRIFVKIPCLPAGRDSQIMAKNTIPIYDIYKNMAGGRLIDFALLEESYTPYDAASPHRHNYFEILFFREGGGLHEIDFSSFPIGAMSLHFVSPEQVHLLRREPSVTGYVLSFTRDLFFTGSEPGFIDSMPFFDNPSYRPVVSLPGAENDVAALFEKIRREFDSGNNDKNELLKLYLSTLLVTARRLYVPESTGNNSPRSELTRRFKKLVDQHFMQHKGVSEYAAMLNITAGHLNDTVQKDTGKTASEVIHERVILEAKRFLYHSPKSVKEIAFEMNYDDPSHFSRFFKSYADLTPEQFRKQIREKYH